MPITRTEGREECDPKRCPRGHGTAAVLGVRPWPRSVFPASLGKRRKNREAHRETEGRGPQQGPGRPFPGAREPLRPGSVLRVPGDHGPEDVRPHGVRDAGHLPPDRDARPRERRPEPRVLDAHPDAAGRVAAVRDRRLRRRAARVGRPGATAARAVRSQARLQARQPEVGRQAHLLDATASSSWSRASASSRSSPASSSRRSGRARTTSRRSARSSRPPRWRTWATWCSTSPGACSACSP